MPKNRSRMLNRKPDQICDKTTRDVKSYTKTSRQRSGWEQWERTRVSQPGKKKKKTTLEGKKKRLGGNHQKGGRKMPAANERNKIKEGGKGVQVPTEKNSS